MLALKLAAPLASHGRGTVNNPCKGARLGCLRRKKRTSEKVETGGAEFTAIKLGPQHPVFFHPCPSSIIGTSDQTIISAAAFPGFLGPEGPFRPKASVCGDVETP